MSLTIFVEQDVDSGSVLQVDGEMEQKHEVELSASVEGPPPPPPIVEENQDVFVKPDVEPVSSPRTSEVPMEVDIVPATPLTAGLSRESTASIHAVEDHHDEAAHEDSEPERDEVQVEQALAQIAEDELPASDDHSAAAVEETITAPSAEDISMEEAEIPPAVEVEEAEVPLKNESKDEGEIDQQSDLTALSDSEFSKSPIRPKVITSRRARDQEPSSSSGELTELPTPDESEGQPAGEEAILTGAEGTSEQSQSARKSSRRKSSSSSKGKAKTTKKQTAPPLDPDAGKVVLRDGQALLDEGTLGEYYSVCSSS